MSSKKIGCVFTNKSGDTVKVIEYLNADNCTIQFEDGVIITKVSFRRLKYGKFIKPIKREGEEFISNQGYKVKIIEYKSAKNCTVIINDDYICENLVYSNIKKGEVNYPYHLSVLGVGYLGVGVTNKKSLSKWRSMLNRCYNSDYKDTHPTYEKIEVCKEWLNYQNFKKWYEDNYIENFELDKDILVKGNKIYSPETCCFIPQEVNKVFTKTNSKRGQFYIGVHYNKKENKYVARVNKSSQKIYVGIFNTPEEAFQAYKTAKEGYIKEVADKWKGKITEQVYEAMYNYQVEIID